MGRHDGVVRTTDTGGALELGINHVATASDVLLVVGDVHVHALPAAHLNLGAVGDGGNSGTEEGLRRDRALRGGVSLYTRTNNHEIAHSRSVTRPLASSGSRLSLFAKKEKSTHESATPPRPHPSPSIIVHPRSRARASHHRSRETRSRVDLFFTTVPPPTLSLTSLARAPPLARDEMIATARPPPSRITPNPRRCTRAR